MPFRETIEAILKVKDAKRFKTAMDMAARSVEHYGRQAEEAAAQSELLRKIDQKLERTSGELTVALQAVASSVDNVGDEMLQAAAKTEVANRVMKKSGSNAVFLGKSWAFWKDRLSLTRSEIVTTGLTILTYFSPAVIAMGSSFAYAAVGGGGVALAGLSTFIVGLGSMLLLFKPVTSQIQKVMKAQDQYNLAVAQFGASSQQASRASAHMYGVIQTQGGKPVLNAVTQLRKFKKEISDFSGAGRNRLLGTMSAGLRTASTLFPSLNINQMALGFSTAMKQVFRVLRTNDFRQTLRTLSQTFDRAIGPAAHGFANVFIVLGRIIRATAPWVVRWANAWERTTMSWRRGTRDSTKLSAFFDKAVGHFKAWWGLAKALGRALAVVFGASEHEGFTVVQTLTDLVNKFTDWFTMLRDTGAIDRFWSKYNSTVKGIADNLSLFVHSPIDAINQWLPSVLQAIARVAAHAGTTFGRAFITAFIQGDAWTRLFLTVMILRFTGFGRKLGAVFAMPFITAFAARMGLSFAAGGAIRLAMVTGAERAGAALAAALLTAAPFVIPVTLTIAVAGGIGWAINKALNAVGLRTDRNFNPHSALRRQAEHTPTFDQGAPFRRSLVPYGRPPKHRQMGGMIFPGTTAMVGEAGPEMAVAGWRGTMITPIHHQAPDIPNLADKLRITVFSTINVERREIARAVSDEKSYVKARRGGRSAQNG